MWIVFWLNRYVHKHLGIAWHQLFQLKCVAFTYFQEVLKYSWTLILDIIIPAIPN